MTINLIKPSLTLLAEYVNADEYVRFFEGGIVHTFFDDELDIVQQSQDFFDFVASVVRNISYNVVDNWCELNDCFSLFEEMSDSQKVLFAYVLADYSYSYDLPFIPLGVPHLFNLVVFNLFNLVVFNLFNLVVFNLVVFNLVCSQRPFVVVIVFYIVVAEKQAEQSKKRF